MVGPMDNLTHTAIGLFLSRAGLKEWTPRATPILMLAANAPDIDFVSALGGSLSYLHYHRHWTHSLLAVPLIAILPVILVRFAGRLPVNWWKAWIASSIAVLSHLLLDLTNVYGIRLFLPFSGRWLHLDWTNVIDLWIWAISLLAIVGPLIGKLVGSEITSGAARVKHHGRGFAWFALSFVALYNGGRAVLHARAIAVLDSRVYQGAEALGVTALPHAVNPLHWGGLAETQGFWVSAAVDLPGDFDPTRGAILHKAAPEPAIEAARATATFQEFLRFSQSPLWRVTPVAQPESGRLVQVFDLRFGTPLSPGFAASAVVDGRLQVVEEEFTFRPRAR
jgi:inner membrane protein